jgi:hypothetical protein
MNVRSTKEMYMTNKYLTAFRGDKNWRKHIIQNFEFLFSCKTRNSQNIANVTSFDISKYILINKV